MKFTEIRPVAERLLQAMRPLCWTIEIAGSLRRRRPDCNNIDIVCVPRTSSRGDPRNDVQLALIELANHDQRVAINHGAEPNASGLLFVWRDIPVNVVFADWTSLASLFVWRTGSREHNEFIANRAASRGLRWVPNIGFHRGDVTVRSLTETMFYAELGLPYIPPEQRELPGLQQFMDDKPIRNT